jgi:polyvinyl alcohol dehydrogenase (cytochrome)
VPRAADRAALGRLSPDLIRQALTSGSMRTQGEGLTADQVDALARLLGRAPAPSRSADNACSTGSAPWDPSNGPQWNGWGAGLTQHRFQPAAMAQLAANQVPRLRLKWAFGFPGVNRAFGQPTVVGGRVFVGSAAFTVFSLSSDTGCQHWSFRADAPVRTSISIGPRDESGSRGWTAYFGDQRANRPRHGARPALTLTA